MRQLPTSLDSSYRGSAEFCGSASDSYSPGVLLLGRAEFCRDASASYSPGVFLMDRAEFGRDASASYIFRFFLFDLTEFCRNDQLPRALGSSYMLDRVLSERNSFLHLYNLLTARSPGRSAQTTDIYVNASFVNYQEPLYASFREKSKISR